MKRVFILFLSLCSVSVFISCKSAITTQDVFAQEAAANKALKEAQEELVELAHMKEQYSVDGVKAEIKELEKEKAKIDKDISSLKKVSHSSTADATEGLVGDLKGKSALISKKIEALKGQSPENWSETIESVNKSIETLRKEVDTITASLTNPEG